MQTYKYAQMHVYTFSKVWGMQEGGLLKRRDKYPLQPLGPFFPVQPPKRLKAIPGA